MVLVGKGAFAEERERRLPHGPAWDVKTVFIN